MRGEHRQQAVRRVDELLVHLLGEVLQKYPLVRHSGAVMDPVVCGEPAAEVLEHSAPRRAGDQPEPRDDQPLVEDLHQEDLLLECVRLEGRVRELVEVRIALGRAACFGHELQPRLGMTRLVLDHGRVVELCLDVRRNVEKLRGHIAREHVRLELLRQHGAPHVATPSLALRRAFPLGDRRHLAPGKIAHLPFASLRELVEPQDLGEGLTAFVLHLDQLTRCHCVGIIPVSFLRWS